MSNGWVRFSPPSRRGELGCERGLLARQGCLGLDLEGAEGQSIHFLSYDGQIRLSSLKLGEFGGGVFTGIGGAQLLGAQ